MAESVGSHHRRLAEQRAETLLHVAHETRHRAKLARHALKEAGQRLSVRLFDDHLRMHPHDAPCSAMTQPQNSSSEP